MRLAINTNHDVTPRGFFPSGAFIAAHCDFVTAKALYDYTVDLNLGEPLAPEEMHCTIMYSKKGGMRPYPVCIPPSNILLKPLRLAYIGNAIALLVNHSWLRSRYNLARYCGYRSQFGGYIPHISLTYSPNKIPNLSSIRFPSELLLGIDRETIEPLKAQ